MGARHGKRHEPDSGTAGPGAERSAGPGEAGGTAARRVAVVGGGMMGIGAALRLAESGCRVTLFEGSGELGGLSSSFQWGRVAWDRFYHVVLSTDRILIDFLKELGLADRLFFARTKTGFYGRGRLVSFSSIGDFIRFPFMTLPQKIRLVFGILRAISMKDAAKLDRIYVRQWLTRLFGRRLYEEVWEPLLRSKFGSARERTSAAFMWATITRLYRARDAEEKQERMGHVRGGYRAILGRARERLEELGVRVLLDSRVESLQPADGMVEVEWQGRTERFDRALLTVACPEVLRLLRGAPDDGYLRRLGEVEYLSVTCGLLILSRRLSPYYVTNLLDRDLPFTGVVEATNVVPPEEVGGTHLVYLPKYATSDDPIHGWSDARIIDLFVAGLRRIFPDLRDEEILYAKVFRARYVQPLQELGFLERSLAFRTPQEGIYLVNTSMIRNSTLNNNAVLTLARAAASEVTADLFRREAHLASTPARQPAELLAQGKAGT